MMHILVLAPRLNGTVTGEAYTAFKLLEAMAPLCRLTILAHEVRVGPPLAEQIPAARVHTFDEPAWAGRQKRLSSMLKLGVFSFNRQAAEWLRGPGQGTRFDLAHQMLPRAPRYPTVLRHGSTPYVLGTVGGALPTPPAFAGEMEGEAWFTRLRGLDHLRMAWDPALRASYGRADLVLGVAPYMQDILAPLPIKRFEPFLGIGVSDLAPEIRRPVRPGALKLLHVGRTVRTKGLRDTIRALAHLSDLPNVTLTAVGDGPDMKTCQDEAVRLGVADRVVFTGRLSRDEIEARYKQADVFVFPSFRESMGGVLYEAMRWGLPVVTVRTGGPDHIVGPGSGLKVDLTTPEQMPRDLAVQIRRLVDEPELRFEFGQGARRSLADGALWSQKAQAMIALYEEILGTQHLPAEARA